jgi:hypothetical protein
MIGRSVMLTLTRYENYVWTRFLFTYMQRTLHYLPRLFQREIRVLDVVNCVVARHLRDTRYPRFGRSERGGGGVMMHKLIVAGAVLHWRKHLLGLALQMSMISQLGMRISTRTITGPGHIYSALAANELTSIINYTPTTSPVPTPSTASKTATHKYITTLAAVPSSSSQILLKPIRPIHTGSSHH